MAKKAPPTRAHTSTSRAAASKRSKPARPARASAASKKPKASRKSSKAPNPAKSAKPAAATFPLAAPLPTDEAVRIVRRFVIHHGKKYQYHDVVLRAADGSELHRQMVKHPGAVVILPLLDTPDGLRVVLIRNERFAVAQILVELPAGTLEPDEPPEVSGIRELEEEIGYTTDSLTSLGAFYTTPGLTDEVMHAYAATNLRHVGQRLEADENITVQLATPDEAFAMIDNGTLTDAKSMLALMLARRRGLL